MARRRRFARYFLTLKSPASQARGICFTSRGPIWWRRWSSRFWTPIRHLNAAQDLSDPLWTDAHAKQSRTGHPVGSAAHVAAFDRDVGVAAGEIGPADL